MQWEWETATLWGPRRMDPNHLRFRTTRFLRSLALCPLIIAGALSGAPVISELSATNDSGIVDSEGDRSDWIEIFNPDTVALDLAGYRLSDSEDELSRWVFPSRTMMPGEYLVVFASGKDRRPPGPGAELHTNFSLNGSGEYLGLLSPEGVVLQEFSPEYPEQLPDISYGPGNGTAPLYWATPTPGAPNTGPRYGGLVGEVKFSRKRGYYATPFFLDLTSGTPGARIVYTTDGSAPSLLGGRVYNGPISITGTTIIRAVATMGNGLPSRVKSHSYLFANDVRHQEAMSRAVVEDPVYKATIADEITMLPVLSLSVRDADFFGSNGIYTNFAERGEEAEIPVSVEFFDPSNGEDFQVDAGLRIHGGQARFHDKKPMRLYFRSQYGPSRLEHPLFAGSMVQSFDQLVLRSCGHDSWAVDWKSPTASGRNDLTETATYLRDEFMRRTEQEMGLTSPHGRFVQVYINGRYWGMYDLHERANAAFFADHFGGREKDWDVLGAYAQVADGNKADWADFQAIAARGVTSQRAYEEIREYLDLDSYIDSMISRIWSGDHDWLDPLVIGGSTIGNPNQLNNNNWFAGRESRGVAADGSVWSPFRFFCWDTEISMGNDRFLGSGNHQLNFDLSQVRTPDSPGAPYNTMRNFEEFRIAFADRLQKHFFNEGSITPTRNIARWDGFAADGREAIVGESARWGNIHGGTPLRRDVEWEREVEWMRENYLPVRTNSVLGYFRNRQLYPNLAPPVPSSRGGSFPDPVSLTLDPGAQSGTIYYTLDGSDPRKPASTAISYPVNKRATASVLVPSPENGGDQLGASWRDVAPPANIDAWRHGPTGIGYENVGEDFRGIIGTDVEAEMAGTVASVFIRVPFTMPSQASIDALAGLVLKMRYDDGFVVYLNGVEVARANAPSAVEWNSQAITSHADSAALAFEPFDISSRLSLLRVGENMLAIHGLNAGVGSSDFLIMPRLMGIGTLSVATLSPTANVYGGPITVDRSLTLKARFSSPTIGWSAMEEARFTIGDLPATRGNLAVTEIHYHPLGPITPSEVSAGLGRGDFEFLELRNLSASPINLRGVAFASGVDFEFEGSAITRLMPGENVLLVSNLEAFTARYGASSAARVAGVFGNGTQLSNSGERLLLLDREGKPIEDFVYDDDAPWPTSADGTGFSLERVKPLEGGDPGSATNWRASRMLHGSPGYEPDDADSDGDGLPDDWERRFFNDSLAQTGVGDFENDGLSNAEEFATGTDPHRPDTDGDGVNDGEEVHLRGTDPLKADTDGDAVEDGAEIAAGTDPREPDTDHDGLDDGEEAVRGTNPRLVDTDGDGFSDGLEVARGSDPRSANSVLFATARDLEVYSPMDSAGIQDGVVENLAGSSSGKVRGAILPGEPGRIAEALGFAGTSPGASVDYAGAGDPGTGSLTVAFWFKASVGNGTEVLANKGNAGVEDEGWSVYLDDGEIYCRARTAGGEAAVLSNASAPVVDVWRHLALVVDNETGRLRAYLDGSDAGWVTGTGGVSGSVFSRGSSLTSALPLRIGAAASGAAPFTGSFDDLAVWHFALGAEEIGRIYRGGLFGRGADISAGEPLDLDFDGLPDSWEQMFFGNLDARPDGDADGDGLTNGEEFRLGTHPGQADTDGDGIEDRVEVLAGSDPATPNAPASGSTLFDDLLIYSTLDLNDLTTTRAGGRVFDRSSPGENGVILGGFRSVPGALGSALAEGGGISYGDVHDPGATGYTVSLWVRPRKLEAERTRILVGKGSAGLGDGWHIALFGERFGAFGAFDDGSTWLAYNDAPPPGTEARPGQWSLLMLMLDPASRRVRFFVNGIEIGYGDDGREIPVGVSITAPGEPLLAGRISTLFKSEFDFDGGMDELAIWGRALDAGERSAVAAGGVVALGVAALNGQGGDPRLSLDADQLTVSLNPGEARDVSLGISNSGSGALNWVLEADLLAERSLEETLEDLDAGIASVTSLIPLRYNFTEGVTGNFINDGGLDMYDGGNILGTSRGGPLNYSDGVVRNDPAVGPGGRYFTRKYPGLFVLAADLDGVDSFEVTGNLGADSVGSVSGTELEIRFGSRRFVGFVKRVYDGFDANFNTTDPSVNQLILFEDSGSSPAHSFSADTDNDQHRVTGLTGVGRFYYLLFASANGRFVDDAEMQAIMNAFLGLLEIEPGWLQVAGADEGVVPPGARIPALLRLDTLDFAIGDNRNALLRLFNNDPVRTLVEIPVRLHVNAAPTALPLPELKGDEDGGPLVAHIHAAFDDPESGAAGLTYRISTGPLGDALFSTMEFDPASGMLTLALKPDAFGETVVSVDGTDSNGLSASSAFRVIVHAVPDPPVTTGLPDITADEAASMTEMALSDFFSDADPGDSLFYGVRSNSNPGLFSMLEIDPVTGRLLIAYSPFIGGVAEVTVFARDNTGTETEDTFTVTLPPVPAPDLAVSSTQTLNRQTGLIEQRVTVTNRSPRDLGAVRLLLSGLPSGVAVHNASALLPDGRFEILYNRTLPAGQSVVLLVEYYAPSRLTALQPELVVETGLHRDFEPTVGADFAIRRLVRRNDGSVLLEFPAEPGRRYIVQYTDDFSGWRDASVALRAGGTRVQWIDSGPPKTSTFPALAGFRSYRVVATE